MSTIPLGPFKDLRNGVTGKDEANPEQAPNPTAEFFMWEQFTTKPHFHPTEENPQPPLKKIGEIFTPWPSWMIVASTSVFPDPENDQRLEKLFQVLDQGIRDFEADTAQVVKLLGTGDFGCHYVADDALEWLKDVKFTNSTRGIDSKIVGNVVDILKVAGVIDVGLKNEDAIQRVIGIQRGGQ